MRLRWIQTVAGTILQWQSTVAGLHARTPGLKFSSSATGQILQPVAETLPILSTQQVVRARKILLDRRKVDLKHARCVQTR